MGKPVGVRVPLYPHLLVRNAVDASFEQNLTPRPLENAFVAGVWITNDSGGSSAKVFGRTAQGVL